jgi:flavin-dependent dehydrogenase
VIRIAFDFGKGHPMIGPADVVILGGGPAGTSTAIALARAERSVIVLERSRYGAARIGETLPPRVRELLARLGVWESFLAAGHLRSPGVASTWSSPETNMSHFFLSPYGHGWHVDRRRFDSMLAMQAESLGAIVHQGARVLSCARKLNGAWSVEANVNGESVSYEAKFAIDATGRAAWLARREGARHEVHDRLIGLVAYLSIPEAPAALKSLALIEATERGWWYSADLPDGRMVAAFMTDADFCPAPEQRQAFWESQLKSSARTRARLEGCCAQFLVTTVAADSRRLDRTVGRDWLAVGDAAAAVDPLSSQGLMKAMESGLDAAEAIVNTQAGDPGALSAYGARLKQRWSEYLDERFWYYGQVTRWPGSPFWRRRQLPVGP